MIVDSHCHIFNTRIVNNMQDRPDMVDKLKLNVFDSLPRLEPAALDQSAEVHGIDWCLLLPTAAPDKVRTENDRFIGFTNRFPRLRTLATLHPTMEARSDEITRMFEVGINGFKFSSFSQRFDPLSREFGSMLADVQRLGRLHNTRPVLVFDTFVLGDFYFGANPDHLTTPTKLARLAHEYRGVNFVGAHMGGLLANFDDLRRDLPPAPNLYLDTSNASHTLDEEQFIELLRIHGSGHVLFGTDWPWFHHTAELPKIRALLIQAGYNSADQAAVFGENAGKLFRFHEGSSEDA